MTSRRPPSTFQRGSTLVSDDLYIVRPADDQLVKALASGGPCHVLGPRQIGKSSLKLRATRTLVEAHQRRVAEVDLSSVGSPSTPEERWLYTLADELFRSASSTLSLDALWDDARAAAANFGAALRALATEVPERPLTVFLDEVDALMGLPFGRDVLATLRALLNARAEEAALRAFSLCMIGGHLASEIAPDLNHSPFIGLSIELDDFTLGELNQFAPWLAGLGASPEELLSAVYRWTTGHPAFSQSICAELVLKGFSSDAARSRVAAIVSRLFLSANAFEDNILSDSRTRFSERSEPTRRVLSLYREVLRSGSAPRRDTEDEAALCIAGLARVEGPRVVRRNEIYATVFNVEWVEARLVECGLWLDAHAWKKNKNAPLLAKGALEDALRHARGSRSVSEVESRFLDASSRAEIRSGAASSRLLAVTLVIVSAATAALWYLWSERERVRGELLSARAYAAASRDAKDRAEARADSARSSAEATRRTLTQQVESSSRELATCRTDATRLAREREDLLAFSADARTFLTLKADHERCAQELDTERSVRASERFTCSRGREERDMCVSNLAAAQGRMRLCQTRYETCRNTLTPAACPPLP